MQSFIELFPVYVCILTGPNFIILIGKKNHFVKSVKPLGIFPYLTVTHPVYVIAVIFSELPIRIVTLCVLKPFLLL